MQGIVKICHQGGGGNGPGGVPSKLTVTFLVFETAGEAHKGTPTSAKHWLTEQEITQQPKFVLENSIVALLTGVGEKLRNNEPVYPCEVLECVNVGNGRKIEKRRETDRIGERPQLVRAKSLEDQMLLQAGYGEKGEYFWSDT